MNTQLFDKMKNEPLNERSFDSKNTYFLYDEQGKMVYSCKTFSVNELMDKMINSSKLKKQYPDLYTHKFTHSVKIESNAAYARRIAKAMGWLPSHTVLAKLDAFRRAA